EIVHPVQGQPADQRSDRRPVNRRIDHGHTTRDRIVAVAIDRFGERGYEATSIEAVLEAAHVSRGALYHHFPGKEALFEAAMLALEARIGEESVAVGQGLNDAESVLRAGCLSWVRLAGDPVV